MPDEKQTKLELVEEPSIFDDLEALRKVSVLKVSRKVIQVNVTVDKPAPDVYFRVHDSDAFSLECSVLIDKKRGKTYFVAPHMLGHPVIRPRLRPVLIVTTITWPGSVIGLWPVPLTNKSSLPCWRTARAAVELAKGQWCQLCWNEDTQDYLLSVADPVDEAGVARLKPDWPADLNFNNLLKLGFADEGTVGSADHSYVAQLRGVTR